jgi:hypothetical protein
VDRLTVISEEEKRGQRNRKLRAKPSGSTEKAYVVGIF